MSAKETIPTRLTPPLKPLRPKASQKAQQLLQPEPSEEEISTQAPSPSPSVKMTTKVLPEHVDWMKQRIATFSATHPRAPKLKIEELVQIALDELRRSENLYETIRQYRN